MEDNRSHIDHLLKEKMQGMHFELNEAHWADVERRLDEDDRKKKPLWLLFFAVVVLVGAGLTALTNGNLAQNKDARKASTIEEPTQINPSQVAISTTEETSKLSTNEDNAQPNSMTDANNDYAQVESKQSSSTTSQANIGGFTKASERRKSNAAVKSNNVNESAVTARASDSKNVVTNRKTKKQTRNNTKKLNVENNPTNNAMAISKPQNKKVERNLEELKQKNKEAKTINRSKSVENKVDSKVAVAPKKSPITASKVAKNISTIAAKTEATNSVTPTNKNSDAVVMLGNTRVYRSPEEYQKMNPRYVAGLENYTYNETVIPLGQEKSDSLRNLIAQQKKEIAAPEAEIKVRKNKTERIYIQDPSNFYMLLGIAGARGYKGNLDGTPVWGLSPSIGAGYEFTFSDKMSIYLSAFMSYVSHLNIKETSSNIAYSFDRDSTLLSVTRKNLLQLNLPIELSYKILPKHRLYGGLGINLGVNSVSLYEDSKANSSKKQFGYMGGIRFMDLTASLGYEFAVSRRFSIGAFYQQGFFDMTKNDYFNNQHKDINARGGIRLRYKFIK